MLSSVLLVVSVLVAFVSPLTVNVKDLTRTDEPEANGSTNFNYMNDDTKKAAQSIQQFYTDAEEELNKYIERLKTSNTVLKSLKDYEDAINSVDGTKCEVSSENKNKFNGAEENVEAIVDICAGSVSKADFDTLNNTITEDLAKVQAIDNTLRLNSEICFSLRVPPSPNCQKAKQDALKRLKNVLSQDELTRLTELSKQTSDSAKQELEKCVSDNSKSVEDNINDSIKASSDCKDKQQ